MDGNPTKLRSTTKSELCEQCMRKGYTIEDAPIVGSAKSTVNESSTEKSSICSQCSENPAATSFKTKLNPHLKPGEVLLSRDVRPDDVPLCVDCARALVKEFQEHGVIGYFPPSELETCDCCLYQAEDLDSEDGDQLCASCKAVFWTAQVLSTSDVTDEAEIIPTLAFAAHRARRALPFSEHSARDYPHFELTRTVDDVPVLRLKSVIVEVVRYPGSDLAKLVQIKVLSKFAEPDTIAGLYQEVLQRERLPVSGRSPKNVFWDYKDRDRQLVVTAAPLEEIPSSRLPHLVEYPAVRRFSFPLISVVKAVCEAVIGSPRRPGTKGDEMFATKLGDHDRPRRKTARTTIPACVAWYIGEHYQHSRPAERRPRVAKMLNRHLLKPLGKKMLADDPWSPEDPVWDDANEVGPRFDLARLFFQAHDDNSL